MGAKSLSLHSGELAKRSGVSADTIRHYERIGILPKMPRTESGYRLYPESAIERILVVQRSLRLGFTLAELAEVSKARDAGLAPCKRVHQLATAKLGQVTKDIAEMKQTQRYLKRILADWDTRIQRSSAGQKSNLLHSLTGPVSAKRTKNFRRKK
jgi:DNA-binding transcriptional MerR regulator